MHLWHGRPGARKEAEPVEEDRIPRIPKGAMFQTLVAGVPRERIALGEEAHTHVKRSSSAGASREAASLFAVWASFRPRVYFQIQNPALSCNTEVHCSVDLLCDDWK